MDRVAARGRVPLIDALRLAGAAPRVAVLRALPLGGLLVAVPALRALRAALPDARATWVGLEPTRAMAARLPHLVDDFLALPDEAAAPGSPHGAAALPCFLERARAGRFDLALQWHGPDAAVDAWAARLGARAVGGFRARTGAAPPAHGGRSRCWPDDGADADAPLASVARLGCPAHGRQLEFPLGEDDARDLHRAWPAHAVCPSWVCLHPGSRPPAPRWSPAGAAAVGRALQATGHTLVLTGGADERRTVDAIVRDLATPPVDLLGRTSLGALGALLAGARALVTSDPSMALVADAVGCPSVTVRLGSDGTGVRARGVGGPHRAGGTGPAAADVLAALARLGVATDPTRARPAP